MRMNEIRAMAKQRNIAPRSMNKKELIRAVQQAEGNTPCFMTNQPSCDQHECCWRSDCKPGEEGVVS